MAGMTTQTPPADETHLPSDDDVASFWEHGYFLSPPIVPEHVLDEALRGMDRFYAGDLDAPFPGRTRYDEYDWRPEHGDVLRKNDYASLMVVELGALVRYPLIAATAARLVGAEAIRLWHDQLLFKPPERTPSSGNVGWHTDRQYWHTCTADDMLTAWVPLVDVDERLGPLTFVDGSHRWPETQLDFFDGDLEAGERRFREGRDGVQKISAPLRRGQVSFHHCRTIHGSGPNRGGVPRRSMAIHLQPGTNRYQAEGPDGRPAYHRNDELVRQVDGHPDYADPRICPLLFATGSK